MLHNQVRIIGGQWRSRRLAFPPLTGLRPTPDRVRETLFNWLMPTIHGARCLDLFAGSGALGFEALSRGAEHVVFLDSSHEVVDNIHANAALLKTHQYEAFCVDALSWLKKAPEKQFDIVFVDPPYALQWIEPCLSLLKANHFLTDASLIYVEDDKAIPDVPGYVTHRESKASSVWYRLLSLQCT